MDWRLRSTLPWGNPAPDIVYLVVSAVDQLSSFLKNGMSIRFGTSGWRAVIADEFTFAGVRAVTEAICTHFSSNANKLMIVGFDTRFLGEKFAVECADVITANGFRVLLCSEPTPTPTLSHAIRTQGAICGINFTASHNPPEYNGMKLSTADGAPALPEITRHVEGLIAQSLAMASSKDARAPQTTAYETFAPRPAYLADLESKISFNELERAGGRYAYDPLWGTGRGYLDQALRMHGVEVETIHDWRDVLFGGRSPEPEASHLEELREVVLSKNCVLGLATDGDGDRLPDRADGNLTDRFAEELLRRGARDCGGGNRSCRRRRWLHHAAATKCGVDGRLRG